MITSSGEVRVLDFGFARNRALDLHSASTLHEAPIAVARVRERRTRQWLPAGRKRRRVQPRLHRLRVVVRPASVRRTFGAARARSWTHVRRASAGLSNRQMQALQRALLWTRGERKIDVVELLSALGCAETASAGAATPEEILAVDESRPRWARLATHSRVHRGRDRGRVLLRAADRAARRSVPRDSNAGRPPPADREASSRTSRRRLPQSPAVERAAPVNRRPGVPPDKPLQPTQRPRPRNRPRVSSRLPPSISQNPLRRRAPGQCRRSNSTRTPMSRPKATARCGCW